MTNWRWNGARWWRFDFHTHTPASCQDYGKGPDQESLLQRTPHEWLLDFMRAGIDCVAITDHNSGAWIDDLQAALVELESRRPEGFRPIFLFPGVEVSVHGGIHVLAIFASATTTSDLDSLLGAVGFDGTKGASDSVTNKPFCEVAEAVGKAGGIAIPAHVDRDRTGLLKLQGTTLEQALGSPDVFAMEVIDPSSAKPQLYHDKHLAWTEVLGSDSHHPSQNHDQQYPGSHFTWVKMGEPSLEGLRLALLDGPLSVRRSDQQTGDPNDHAALAIESIKVSKARYMGRPSSFRVEFNPWLNAVIGGRGTGKSTLLEFLRIALRRTGELPKSLKKDIEKYGSVYPTRNDDGLLTPDSVFDVIYRKNGARYRIQWSQKGDRNPIEMEGETGAWTVEPGDVEQRFPVRIYSQKQIFELAKDPLALLTIVDESPRVDRRSWEEEWREQYTRFLSLRTKAREIESALADEPRLKGDLEDTMRKLGVFEGADYASVLKEYQRRVRQRRAVETWEEEWSTVGGRIRDLATDVAPEPLDPEIFGDPDTAGRDLVAKSSVPMAGLQRVHDRLQALAQEMEDHVTDWNKTRDQSEWTQAVEAAITAYDTLRRRLQDEGAGDPSTYGELVQRRQNIEVRLRDLENRRKQVESVRREADLCLDTLLALRRRLTALRTRFIEDVLEGNTYVRIQVIPYGARETVESEIRALIQREDGRFERDIGATDREDGLLGGLYIDSPDTSTLEHRIGDLKGKLQRIAEGRAGSLELHDQRFAGHMDKLPPEALDRLAAWFPEDTLDVQYSTAPEGTVFRSIQEGSPGQKTAALLAFLLSYGEEPIVLDQPEDDLDNNLIYDLIVQQLRSIKQHRQVIAVTHNANIVVNGDAELVVPLAAGGGQTRVSCSGSLQQSNVRDTICKIMEGGRDAFEQRYRRISLEGRRV